MAKSLDPRTAVSGVVADLQLYGADSLAEAAVCAATLFERLGFTATVVLASKPFSDEYGVVLADGREPLPAEESLMVLGSGSDAVRTGAGLPVVFATGVRKPTHGCRSAYLFPDQRGTWIEQYLDLGGLTVGFWLRASRRREGDDLRPALSRAAEAIEALAPLLARSVHVERSGQDALLRPALAEIDQLLARTSLTVLGDFEHELDPLYQLIADKAVAATDAAICDITLVRGGDYEAVAQAGVLAGAGQSVSTSDELGDDSVTVRAIILEEPSFIHGPRTDRLFERMLESLGPDEARKARLRAQQAWGAFPLRLGDQVLGALALSSEREDFFDQGVCTAVDVLSSRLGLILALRARMTDARRAFENKDSEIRSLTLRLQTLNRQASFAGAARTVVHNLANLLQPLGHEITTLEGWVKKNQPKRFPQGLLADLDQSFAAIEDTFDFYRRVKEDRHERAWHDINVVLREAVDFARPGAEQNRLDITLRPATGRPRVYASDVGLIQAFLNVIVNGLDAMRGQEDAYGRRLLIRASQAEGKVTIRFSDEGVGIRPEVLGRVTEPGFTTKGPDGSGLGLAYVEEEIGKLGGSLEVESVGRGKGTTVTINLNTGHA